MPGEERPRKKASVGQTIGGALFGFEQAVLRTTPPSEELVHHARPDSPVPAADGTLVSIELPGQPDPPDLVDGVGDPPREPDHP